MAINYETLLPTTGGWLYAKDVQQGDYLFDQNGEPTQVLSAERSNEVSQYKVTTQRDEVIFITDDQLLSINYDQITQRTDLANWKNYWKVEKSVALDPAPIDQPLDPYVFGLWFWDYNSNPNPDSVTIPVDAANYPTAVKHLNFAGIEVLGKQKKKLRRTTKTIFRLKTNITVWSKLARDFHSKPTELPDCYRYGSFQQRMALVNSFFASSRCYCTGFDKKVHVFQWVKFGSNQKLTKQFLELCQSVGFSTEEILHNDQAAFLIKSKNRPKASKIKHIEPIPAEDAIDITTNAGSYLITEDHIICLN